MTCGSFGPYVGCGVMERDASCEQRFLYNGNESSSCAIISVDQHHQAFMSRVRFRNKMRIEVTNFGEGSLLFLSVGHQDMLSR